MAYAPTAAPAGLAAPAAPSFRIPAPATPAAPGELRYAVDARAPRPSRAVYLRRRLTVVLAVILLALGLVLFGGAMGAEAGGGAPITGGHVVVEPGQTLWEVAIDNAPAGTDIRGYLADLQDLNGLHDGQVAAWSVVLLPRV